MSRYLDVPFHVGGAGRVAVTDDDDHVRDMIFEVLFTNPGERVNRPDFGCGLRSLVFSPASQVVAAATKVLVKGSLQRWLEREIEVADVDVEAIESEIVVTVAYRRRGDGAFQVQSFGSRRMTVPIDTPDCALDERREALLSPSPPFVDLNGIDFLEVDGADHRIIRITFLKPLPAGAYGLPGDPTRITVSGGTRIVGINVVSASVESASVLRVDVDRGGDYSPYVLALDAPGLDEVRRSVAFSFMASCPTDVDCRPAPCPPELLAEPLIDYLAKDYASFRQLMLDLLPTLNPDWVERNPSDLGIALIELLAYVGDRLSYYQDAVANEAYLDTLRMRVSARRHTRLVDYRMHDGRNAWAPVHFRVASPMTLPRGTALFTRLSRPLPGQLTPPPTVIPAGAITVEGLEQDPALQGVVPFETAFTAELSTENNEIRIHTWGEEECCLAPGATEAYLYSVPSGNTARRPTLAPGDQLVFEEAIGPSTGLSADADPTHRQLVVLESVEGGVTDPLYARTLVAGVPVPRKTGQPALPLLHVRWRRADALAGTLCLSALLPSGTMLRNVSVARGNIVLADHGLTTTQLDGPDALTVDGRLALQHGPLTMERRPEIVPVDPATGAPDADRPALDGDVTLALPALSLRVSTASDVEDWFSVSDLLESGPFDDHFVTEVDDDGRALLRFGDDQYGRSPGDVVSFATVYRVGNGRSGNVGHDVISHVAPAASGASITLRAQPAARPRRHRSRDDRARPTGRAPGVPQRAVPCRHRAGLGPGDRAAARRGERCRELPLDRELADDLHRRRPQGPRRPHRSPQRPNDARSRLRAARPRLPRPLPAGRLRHRAAAAAVRAGRPRSRGLRLAGLLPVGRRAGRPRRAVEPGPRGRLARLLPPEPLRLRPAAVREPPLRGDRERDRRRLGEDRQARPLRTD